MRWRRQPARQRRTAARESTLTTRLGRATAPLAAAHPGRTGIHALPEARAAFAARAILASVADRTLDVQYYIWRADETGWLLFQALWEAAERGVRVRLLLSIGLTESLAAAQVGSSVPACSATM